MLHFEQMFVEKLLQLLVGKINAELFKTVDIEDLESKDIQYTNEIVWFLWHQRFIDFGNEPVKDAGLLEK